MLFDAVELDGLAAKSTGELAGIVEGPVGDDEAPNTAVDEILGGELDHFAGSDEQRFAAFQPIENLSGQLDGGGTDRQPAAAYVGLGAGAFADFQGALEQLVDKKACGAAALGDFQSLSHLTENLGLADDEGIDAAGDAKQMLSGIRVCELVEVAAELADIDTARCREELSKVVETSRVRVNTVDLRAIARGEEGRFGEPMTLPDETESVGLLGFRKRQPLANLHGSRGVVESEYDNAHVVKETKRLPCQPIEPIRRPEVYSRA